MSFSQFDVKTQSSTQFINITSTVQRIVNKSDNSTGVCIVYVPHTTAGITINEAADPSVVYDIINMLNSLIPQRNNYTHREGNSAAHIKTSLVGSSIQIPIVNHSLVLGTWQGIFFCEFDGPRTRQVHVQIIGKDK